MTRKPKERKKNTTLLISRNKSDEPAADFELTPLEHEQQQQPGNNNNNSPAITSLELSSDEESSDLHRRQLQQQQHLLENGGGGDAKFRLSKHAALENEEYGSAAVMEGVVAVWGKWGKYCLIGGMAMMIVA